jgi:hypothetical protein
MAYVNTKTKKALTPFEVRAENPNISFPNGPWDDKLLSSLGYAELRFPDEHPHPGLYQKLVEGEPKLIGNEWFRTLAVIDLTDDEKKLLLINKWLEVRQNRNDLLSACDWTQLADAPITNKEAWVEYRQLLRDVTKVDDPHNVVWPQPPV